MDSRVASLAASMEQLTLSFDNLASSVSTKFSTLAGTLDAHLDSKIAVAFASLRHDLSRAPGGDETPRLPLTKIDSPRFADRLDLSIKKITPQAIVSPTLKPQVDASPKLKPQSSTPENHVKPTTPAVPFPPPITSLPCFHQRSPTMPATKSQRHSIGYSQLGIRDKGGGHQYHAPHLFAEMPKWDLPKYINYCWIFLLQPSYVVVIDFSKINLVWAMWRSVVSSYQQSLAHSSTPSIEKLLDAAMLLNSHVFSSNMLSGGDHSSRVAAAIAESAPLKRESNALVSSFPCSKLPRGNLPHSKNVPPQLNGRSDTVTVDIGKQFVKKQADPFKAQGLGHFLRHMLFMGSTEFPDENEYDSYFSKHGEPSNAYTEAEHTCYHFEVKWEFLKGALRRFSQFFVSPLVKIEAIEIEREVQSTISEFNQVLNYSCCFEQPQCHIAATGHSFNSILWENEKSSVDAMEIGINLREQILKLYRKY